MSPDGMIQSHFREDLRLLNSDIEKLHGVAVAEFNEPIDKIIAIFNKLYSDGVRLEIKTDWGALIAMISEVSLSFRTLKESLTGTQTPLVPILQIFENETTKDKATLSAIAGVYDRCALMVGIINNIGQYLEGANFLFLGPNAAAPMRSVIRKLVDMKVFTIETAGASGGLRAEWAAINKLADLLSAIVAKRGK